MGLAALARPAPGLCSGSGFGLLSLGLSGCLGLCLPVPHASSWSVSSGLIVSSVKLSQVRPCLLSLCPSASVSQGTHSKDRSVWELTGSPAHSGRQ